MATPGKVIITITRSADGTLAASPGRSLLSGPAPRNSGQISIHDSSSGSVMGRKRSEKGAKPPKSAKSDKAGKSENVAEPESSEDRPLGEKMVTQKKGGKGAGKADPKPRPAPKNVGPRRTRGAAREEAAAIGAAMAESVAERTDPVLAEKKVSVAEDSTVPPKDAGVADPEETVERTGGPQGGVQSTQPGGSGFKDSGKESTAAAGSDKGGNGEKGTGKQKEQAKERAAPKPVAGEGVQGAGADKGAAETEMSRRGEVGKKSDAGAPKAQLVQEEAGPSGTAGGGRGPLTTEDTQEGEIGSGEFFGEKISPERLKLISQIAQNVKEGKGGDEALGLSANEFKALADIVSAHNVERRVTSMMEANAAYPAEGVGWEERGTRHFDIPLCMFKNGNDIEKCGVVHPETDSAGRPKRVRVTERMTTPAQVYNGEKIYFTGHIKERGDVTAVVNPFGKPVKITDAERAAMSLEDQSDLRRFEAYVESLCRSEDAGEKARGDWLRDNVMGNWLFLVDGNSRFEGYKRGREKDKANGEVLRTVMFSTFLLRLDKDNMDDVCAMSRQINDNNLEFNSRKSAAQEVYAIYEINDKTQEEMEKVVSNEMLMLYGTHTGKWTKLREEMRVAGANYPGIVFAVALKPTLGLLLMDKSTLSLPKTHVAALGQAKAQWALKRVHCANLSSDKRAYWEKTFSRWVMLEDPERVVPDLDVLDQLSMKHLPVSWDTIMVKLLECAPESFKAMTGMDRTRTNLLQWVKWMALVFNACDAAVVQLQDYGFYEKPETRKKGEAPRLAKAYLSFHGAYDLFEFGKAIIWMQTPDGPGCRPFWWARGIKAFSGVVKPEALNSVRDRLTLAYFRTVEPSRDNEMPLSAFNYLADEPSLPAKVIPQFNVIPVKKLKLDLITRSGFVKIPWTAFKNKDRVYKADKAAMYASWDVEHLRTLGSTPFKEAIKGCRWDADCDEETPTVRVWDKGAEPGTVFKKETLQAAPYIKAEDVEKILKPASSYASWDKKRLLEIRPDSRLCVMAVQSDSAHPGPLSERFPPLDHILQRLAWVTSSSSDFDPTERAVHLCVYMGACAGEAAYDARAREAPAKAAFALMQGLLRYDGSLGVAILPGNTPISWVPAKLEVVAQRYIVFQDKHSGKFNKWGDKCTVYLVLYITPVGSELELPDEEKKFAPALAHKKFHLAGTCTITPVRTIPELWTLNNINNILEGVVPANNDAVAVVLGEENGIATCALLGRGMQVVSVASRRLTEWEGGEGRKLQSTPIDKSFVERARAYRAGEPVPDQFEGLKVEVRSSKGKEQLSEAADEMDARKKGKGKVVEEGTSKKGAGRGRAKNTTAEEGPAKKKGKIGKGEEGGAAGTAKDRKRKAGLDESAQGGAKRQKSTTDPVVAGAAGPSGAAVGGSGGTGTQAGQSAADTAREHHPPVQTQDAYKRFEDDFLVDPEENVGGDL